MQTNAKKYYKQSFYDTGKQSFQFLRKSVLDKIGMLRSANIHGKSFVVSR